MGDMQTHGAKSNPPSLGKLRVPITVLALVILAGSVLLVWLMDDRHVRLVLALAAILVGWLLALILVEPREDRPPSKIKGIEPSSSNRRKKAVNWKPVSPQPNWTNCSDG
jgi:hypothetical protein